MSTTPIASRELPDDDVVRAALAEIIGVLERRAITHRSLQMSTLTAMLALAIADNARASSTDTNQAADIFVDLACRVIKREVGNAVAQMAVLN